MYKETTHPIFHQNPKPQFRVFVWYNFIWELAGRKYIAYVKTDDLVKFFSEGSLVFSILPSLTSLSRLAGKETISVVVDFLQDDLDERERIYRLGVVLKKYIILARQLNHRQYLVLQKNTILCFTAWKFYLHLLR